MSIERNVELRRRRHRRKKLKILERKLKSAKHSEIQVIKQKVRKLTAGAEVIFANWKIEE